MENIYFTPKNKDALPVGTRVFPNYKVSSFGPMTVKGYFYQDREYYAMILDKEPGIVNFLHWANEYILRWELPNNNFSFKIKYQKEQAL